MKSFAHEHIIYYRNTRRKKNIKNKMYSEKYYYLCRTIGNKDRNQIIKNDRL